MRSNLTFIIVSLSGVVTLIKTYPVAIIATAAPAAKRYLTVLDAILKNVPTLTPTVQLHP
jgi:hypothetical protein